MSGLDPSGVSPALRASFEYPKPRDWQDFQRRCRVLFRWELNDPHVKEYGRNGQEQHGIDLLGKRDGRPGHLVGVQCRRYDDPLKFEAMNKDCRRALAHFTQLKEIIFATTAPDDTHTDDSAERIERELAEEGITVRVVVYGWGQLQDLITRHPEAYQIFFGWAEKPPPTPSPAIAMLGGTDPPGEILSSLETIKAELRSLRAAGTPERVNDFDTSGFGI
jgi:hypothetical protein